MKTSFQIYSTNERIFNEIIDLYISAFPSSERRTTADFASILENDDRFNIIVASFNSSFAGFISYWTFNDFIYIEHLAIVESLRGNGLGSFLINQLTKCADHLPILLEVEPDTDTISHNRIKFYNNLGFSVRNDIHYIQPPYALGKESIELWIMTNSNISSTQLISFTENIKDVVYFSHY